MGRHSGGWELRQRTPGGVWYVRFTLAGRTRELSTGTRDYEQARKAAARIYAHHVQQAPVRRATRGAGGPVEELVGEWIASLDSTHDAGTLKTWELYAGAHWVPRWLTVTDITAEALTAYRDARLKAVRATTVRKELSAMRSFLRFLDSPVTVPSVGLRVTGTAFATRRRTTAPELSPEQVEALLAALPDWSTSRKVERFPIRARFVVAYETSLRPSTLDRLEAPKHYRRESTTLLITPDIDKARQGRELPLSQRARDALDAVCPKEGAIFGKHDYREHLKVAAEKVLPADVAARFAGTHLRSARITHLLEQSGNLPGVQYLAGHLLASTTAIYTRPSLRAARAVLGLGAPKKPSRRRRTAKRRSG
jgi:site-specific recombinase XerC